MNQEERNKKLAALWVSGMPVDDICDEIGISSTTLHYWRQRLGLEARAHPMKVSAEDTETIRVKWISGDSATQIARAMGGGRTRNSIIGIVHRNGWKDRKATPPRTNVKVAVRAKPKPVPELTEKQIRTKARRLEIGQRALRTFELHEIESPNARTFLASPRDSCKWPIGDGADMLACCNPVSRGSWCEGHAFIGYAPAQPASLARMRVPA